MKMTMRKFLTFLIMTSLATGLVACGAATAPPVDLPAPVVGRITVGTPDASGKSTISGTEGAVPGGSIVLAINSRIEGSASLMWKVSDALMPKAYAQSIPEICSWLGHWCTIAAEDGSFSMIVDALIGDDLIIVLISEEGIEISDRFSFIIPSTNLALGLCESTDADGSMTDLLNIGGVPIALFEGNGTDPSELLIGPYSLPIPGCFAKSVAITGVKDVGAKVVVISEYDNILWIGTLSVEDRFATAETYEIAYTPLALANIGKPKYLAIALKVPAGFAIGKLGVMDGTIADIVPLPNPTGFEFTEFLGMRLIGPFEDGGFLGAVMLKGSNGSSSHYFLHFFETANFTLASADSQPLNMTLLTGNDFIPADFELSISQIVDPGVAVIIADRGGKALWVGRVHFDSPIQEIKFSTDLASSFAYSLDLGVGGMANVLGVPNITPLRVGIGITQGSTVAAPVAYLLARSSDGLALVRIGRFATNPRLYITPLSDLVDPTLIAVDSFSSSILVGDDGLKEALDLNSLWMPPELL